MVRMFRYMFLLMACLLSSHSAWSANDGSSDRDSTSIDVWIDGWEEEDGSWNEGEAEGGGSSAEAKTYTLRYVVDGKEIVSYNLTAGAAIESIPEPKKEGFVFSGWSEIPTTMPANDVTVTGMFGRLGDVNADGSVNIADANMIVNYFLGKIKDNVGFNMKFADVNSDGKIDIADANSVVNIFLGK